jgi:predicted Ser/Thr protein kinase
MALTTGTRLGPYEIVAPLGAGGMGEVYRAHDTRLSRDVALKILPPEVAGDASRRQRFELEARAVAALSHPNIVSVYDVGEGYIVSELVDGEPLRGVKFGLRKTLDIAVQIANGLAAAHAAGIAHRDLKPDNILLTREGRVKILDFGLAKMTASRAAAAATETLTVQTEPGVVMGTAGYMSPEQVRGQAADHRSDIFSFGLVLYELLAGTRAFTGETSVEVMNAILKEDAPELPESVPPGVRQIVAHCVEKEPANRFQSARDLAFALSSLAQTGSHPVAAVPQAKKRWLIPMAAAVLVAAGLSAAVWWLRPAPVPTWSGVLLGGPEMAICPRISPDGHLLAFVTAMEQVGLMKLESGDYTALTKGQGYVGVVSWSADGAHIYYDRWTDVPRGIYSVPVLGGPEQLVLEDAGTPEALPDGSLLMGRYNADRQYQLMRFWPETGRMQPFPIEISDSNYSGPRAFPDGKAAVTVGTPIGPGREAGEHIYTVDLTSGQVRRLLPASASEGGSLQFGLAVTRDGKSVIATRIAGNLETFDLISRDGRTRTRLPFSVTIGTNFIDAGPDGSIYLDQVDRPTELVRFSPQGGHAERIAAIPAYQAPGEPMANDQVFAVLPDGRAVYTVGTGGRVHLMIVRAGEKPAPLLNTPEESSAPLTAAGPDQVAFLIGPEPWRTIAVATVSNGRLVRRIPFDKGEITSLAASPDGAVLYCAASRGIWAIAASGEARRIHAGDHVAVDPNGRYLVIEVVQTPVIRLFRVPLDGGPEQEIRYSGNERPAFLLGPNSVGRDGRIVMALGSDNGIWPPGILDPSSGRLAQIPVDRALDYHSLGWTPDGNVMAVGLELYSKLWRFTPAAR